LLVVAVNSLFTISKPSPATTTLLALASSFFLAVAAAAATNENACHLETKFVRKMKKDSFAQAVAHYPFLPGRVSIGTSPNSHLITSSNPNLCSVQYGSTLFWHLHDPNHIL